MLDLLREGAREQRLTLADINRSGGTQMRAMLNDETVTEYAEAMQGGAQFPPVTAFYDGQDYWLGDGFHRVAAIERITSAGMSGVVLAIVHAGARRDAVLHAAGANADHGLRRTRADKRRAVETLLRDGEWSQWSNREIARRCQVDEKLVRTLRSELTAVQPQLATTERRYVDGQGNERVMRTGRIGGTSSRVETPASTEGEVADDEGDPVVDLESATRVRRELAGEVYELQVKLNTAISDIRQAASVTDKPNVGERAVICVSLLIEELRDLEYE